MSQIYVSMKTDGQQRKSATGLSANSKAGTRLSCTKSGPSIAKVAKQRCKSKGKNNTELSGRPPPIQPLSLQAQIIGTSLQKAAPRIPIHVPEQSIEHLTKCKLQLFPIDEATREKLEKEKHNPYLELTLSTRKKISSVVTHLSTKWASSKAASGEVMLFPFDARPENLAYHRRWTSRDAVTSAADVYVAVGNPAVFRLRYGWFSSLEPKVCAIPSVSLHSENNLQAGDHKMNASSEKNHPCAESSQEHGLMPIYGSFNQGAGASNILDTSVQAVNKDNLRNYNGASLSWLDHEPNINVGALLSEASRVQNTSSGHPYPVQSNAGFQPSSDLDSFDAAIARIVSRQQATNVSTQTSHSSILDAEETCHAFPAHKFSSSGKGVPASSDPAFFIGSNSMRLHDTKEDVGRQEPASSEQLQIKGDGFPEPSVDLRRNTEDASGEESKAELQRQAEASHNDDNHLGWLDNYNWPVSMGYLEYGAVSCKQIICGDSVGTSGLIASSLDAYQNWSIF